MHMAPLYSPRQCCAESLEAAAKASAAQTALQAERAAWQAAQEAAGPSPEEFESRVAALVSGELSCHESVGLLVWQLATTVLDLC